MYDLKSRKASILKEVIYMNIIDVDNFEKKKSR